MRSIVPVSAGKEWVMSSMQTPPAVPGQSRAISPVATNSIIASLVTLAGVALVVISGGFVYLASYIMRSALMMPPLHDNRDMIPVYMCLAIIPSVCALVTFIFGLRIVSKGLGRLMQQGSASGTSASKTVV
jgi:hypothetical protein